MKNNKYYSIDFRDGKFFFLDQTKLPLREEYVETDDYERIAEAIERLEIRGAPAIGITAAYGLAVAVKDIPSSGLHQAFYRAHERLKKTRPTAVNLFLALEEMKKTFERIKPGENAYEILLKKAADFHKDDIEMCDRIGINGLTVFKKKSRILTHCNTGKLATGGDGTAFNVIKKGFEKGLVEFVYADETRPLLQGSRLTAFELDRTGIPFSIQTDSGAAVLMNSGMVDFVVVGADRIALNGDAANKVGTYNLAVLCNYHNIPFYIAAPTTTIDRSIATGAEIEIEFRNKNEITSVNGNKVVPDHYEVFSPAFDVTPSHLISGIITEEKVYFFPYNFIR